MASDRLKKWKPILDNIFTPYELESEILEMVAEYVENNLENPYVTLGGNGVGPVNPSINYPPYQPPKSQHEVFDILFQYKERLLKDVDVRTEVKSVHFNRTINRIVYELENGDSIYMDYKPLIMKDPNYVKKVKTYFLL